MPKNKEDAKLARKRKSAKYEMGWNDLMGNAIRKPEDERAAFVGQYVNGANVPDTPAFFMAERSAADNYSFGVVEACQAFLKGEYSYKGPAYVVANLESRFPLPVAEPTSPC